ncbi:MAG: SDR family oxidoreductase [Myxococcota bacterium]
MLNKAAREGRPWALVSAGAQGLGAAIVEGLVADGYSVLIHYHRSRAAAEALVTRLPDGCASAVQADLSTPDGCQRIIRAVTGGPGRLDVLVNNLGVYPEKRLPEFSTQEFREIFEVTCTSVFSLTTELLPILRKSARPRVINIGDSAADRIEARVLATPYHIAKIGVNILTRSFAKSLKDEAVTINMVSPGFLENSVGSPGEPLPKDQPGSFEDMMGAIRYLLSPAADYVSGTNIVVSGGWNLG